MKKRILIVILFFIGFINTQIVYGQTIIKMKKEGGVFFIPCSVNGLQLDFIFDTGASTVAISATEALFMLKNGYLTEEDIGSKTYLSVADGSISEGTRINLKVIEFEGLKIFNIEATVINQLSAPLLLGQSALAKLGKFEFDPTNGQLRFLNGTYTPTLNSISLKDAIRLNENEQHDDASSAYKQLISLEPTKGDYYYYWGNNLLDADKADSAAIIFSEGLKKEPSNLLLQIGTAELKLAVGNLNEGKSAIEATVKSAGPKNATIMVVAAEALIRHKKAQDLMLARVYLDAALKLDAKNPLTYNLIGDIYSEENNGSEAARYYNLALEKDGKYIKSVFHKGQLYKRSMSYEIAIAEFNKTLSLDPNFAPAYRELGECYYKMRKPEQAKENYKKYLELSKNNNSARLRYASFLYQSGEYNDAGFELSLITKVDSTNIGMMRMMAYVNYELGKNDTALKTISKLFDITVEDTTKRIGKDYSYFGKILAKGGNAELGTAYIQTALTIDPKQGELYDDLADMYIKQKKYDLSALTYEAKINNSAKAAITDYFNMGRAWYNAKNYMKADSAFAKVTEINATWPNGYFWRGRANAQIDNTAKEGLAKPHYAKFIELASADAANLTKQKTNLVEANSYLAFAAFVAKDCSLSIEYWNKVLEIDPTTKQAKDSIEAIKNSKDCK